MGQHLFKLCVFFLPLLPLVLVDNSASHCDNNKQQYDRYTWAPYDCPGGTVWDEDVGCCVGCLNCNVGWKRPLDCKGLCIKCSAGTYNDRINSYECFPCPKCEEDLHRKEEQQCFRSIPTKCGACLPGYFAFDEYPSTLPCFKCIPGFHPACKLESTAIVQKASTTVPKTTQVVTDVSPAYEDTSLEIKVHSTEKEEGMPLILIIALTIAIIDFCFSMAGLIYMYLSKGRKTRKKGGRHFISEEEDTATI